MGKNAIRRALLALLVLAVLALGHTACGKSYSSPTSPSMSGSPTPGPTPHY